MLRSPVQIKDVAGVRRTNIFQHARKIVLAITYAQQSLRTPVREPKWISLLVVSAFSCWSSPSSSRRPSSTPAPAPTRPESPPFSGKTRRRRRPRMASPAGIVVVPAPSSSLQQPRRPLVPVHAAAGHGVPSTKSFNEGPAPSTTGGGDDGHAISPPPRRRACQLTPRRRRRRPRRRWLWSCGWWCRLRRCYVHRRRHWLGEG